MLWGVELVLCCPILEPRGPMLKLCWPILPLCGPILGLCGPILGRCWPILGLCWPILGLCWPILGLCWPTLGLCWPSFGLCWPSFGLCWPILEPCWPILGLGWPIWRPMLAHLEAYLGPCWPSWNHKIRKMGKHAKSTKHRKTGRFLAGGSGRRQGARPFSPTERREPPYGNATARGPLAGFKGCRPCRRPRKNGQWMKPNWHQYSSVLRTFRFFPFSYVYFYAIHLIKYFDIVRKPTHQTPSPPWAVPRRLQPECGSWAREIIHFIK